MFSGIIEAIGRVSKTFVEESNKRFFIEVPFISELYKGQSIAINGACLTVEKINKKDFEVVAVKETLKKTNLANVFPGDYVNIERALLVGSRLDGHFVLGHVDITTTVLNIEDVKGSKYFWFKLPEKYKKLIIEKGSIAINGVSLTIANLKEDRFAVAIIPYTYNNTTFKFLKSGDIVNLEFDVLGKYVLRLMKQNLL